MTQFDLIVLALLGVSAAVGFFRGAAREIAALVALLGAAAFAIFGLAPASHLARHMVHPDWLAAACALVVVFLIAYIALRLIGLAIARRIHDTDFIGALDRSVGLAIGLARGLIVLGALNLMFNAATPQDLRPHWIIGATSWPLAEDMGKVLAAMAPKGLDIAGKLRPAFDRAVHSAVHDAARDALDDRLKSEGYDARQRGEIEDLVEKSK
jgi:membrane protein required for colicin V production